MKFKQFSFVDFGALQREVKRLEMTAGVRLAIAPSDMSELGVQGEAWFMTRIESSVADIIWTTMGMSKNSSDSAYAQVMASEDIGTYSSVFKAGGFFSAFYFANTVISFDNGMQIEIGSIAGRTPHKIIDRTHELFVGQRKFYPSTEEAINSL